jgi:Ca-activated chloride channel family protein
MSFIWPLMLFTLLLVPLFAGIYLWLQRRRVRLAAAYGASGLAPGAALVIPGWRRHLSPVLYLAGLALLLAALARPQAAVRLPRLQGTVILAFDVSGSMAADDLKPNRMQAARSAAREFVQRQPPGIQVGVVAFSEGGFSVQAPTHDQAAILAAIDRLSPQRGTSLAQGIQASLSTIAHTLGQDAPAAAPDPAEPAPTPPPLPAGEQVPAIIVLLTDGENTAPPDPLQAAQAAAERGVRIYPIGIGSPGGAILQVEGFSVHTRLDEPVLQEIAQRTGGAYFSAASEEELRGVYQKITPELVIKAENIEITSLFAGASILAFLAGGALSLLWFGRLP